jgi:hypothetical protein
MFERFVIKLSCKVTIVTHTRAVFQNAIFKVQSLGLSPSPGQAGSKKQRLNRSQVLRIAVKSLIGKITMLTHTRAVFQNAIFKVQSLGLRPSPARVGSKKQRPNRPQVLRIAVKSLIGKVTMLTHTRAVFQNAIFKVQS